MEVQGKEEGKSQPVKSSKYERKSIAAPKPNPKQPPLVHRRVFGTTRNSNIQDKTVPEKPKWQRPSLKPVLTTPPKEPAKDIASNRKPLPKKLVQTTSAPEEPPKTTQPEHYTPPVQTIPSATEEPPKNAQPLTTAPPAPDEPSKTAQLGQPALAPEEPAKTAKPVKTAPPAQDDPPKTAQPVVSAPLAPEEQPKPARTNKPRKKKSVSFIEGKERVSDAGPTSEGDRVGMRTPRPTRVKPRVSGTPYHTAERCSKCRFDRMETASYWLAQVKLAEAVGKHFVSAGLFKLALECKAEPNRGLRDEVKRYLSRNVYLSGEPEWRDVIASYGLNVTPHDQVEVKARDENGGDLVENNLND